MNGVKAMSISTAATISLPLDIPQVNVLATRQTQDNKFIITVESRRDTAKCGVCKKAIPCNYGHGQAVRLRHLPILTRNVYRDSATAGAMPNLPAPADDDAAIELV